LKMTILRNIDAEKANPIGGIRQRILPLILVDIDLERCSAK
jgi:hypothetical protein